MERRAFVRSLLLGGVTALSAEGRSAKAAQSERRRPNWIIPTNKPDRFGLKVMAFNPIAAPDPRTWELTIEGLASQPIRLKTSDLDRIPHVTQSSRLKCVQCWSGRITWEGFRPEELIRLARPTSEAKYVRVDCADHYYDFVKMEDLLHPRTLFSIGMNGEALTPGHGAPLRLVMPFKYGYKSSKLITKLTFLDKGGRGRVTDGMPYYSETGDILPGVDHPFEFPDEMRKIKGGEIVEY